MTAARRTVLFAAGLAVLAALPFLTRALAPPSGYRCARDGLAIGAHAVRVVGADGVSRRFCGISCAAAWLASRDERPTVVVVIYVVDEATGAEVDAAAAWFVKSRVPTRRDADDRVHAFARREDAERHAAAYGGEVLVGDARPFARFLSLPSSTRSP